MPKTSLGHTLRCKRRTVRLATRQRAQGKPSGRGLPAVVANPAAVALVQALVAANPADPALAKATDPAVLRRQRACVSGASCAWSLP
eukprot:3588452-Lingulodinium_polyedra.AAC.1